MFVLKIKIYFQEDEEATKEVYKDFLATFQDDAIAAGKSFVRGEVVQHGAGHTSVREPGMLIEIAILCFYIPI